MSNHLAERSSLINADIQLEYKNGNNQMPPILEDTKTYKRPDIRR